MQKLKGLRLGLVVLAGVSAFAVLPATSTNFGAVAYAEENQNAAAEKFIQSLTDTGVGFLSDESLSLDQQKKEFKKILTRDFDLNTIGRFALGKHWRKASEAQKKEYLSLFKDMVIDVYSKRFEDYNGQKIEVTRSRPEGKRDVLVSSILKQDGGPDVRLDWRVRKKGSQYKVIDVIVEGVSMSLTQRSDFASVIQRGGGEVEALLVHLRS